MAEILSDVGWIELGSLELTWNHLMVQPQDFFYQAQYFQDGSLPCVKSVLAKFRNSNHKPGTSFPCGSIGEL